MATEPLDPPNDESTEEPRRIRGRTISMKRLSKRELEQGRRLYPEKDYPKPSTRADCVQGEHVTRPCPFVSCKYHLYLDVSRKAGSIKLNFPHLEVWEMADTCSLDVADRGGVTLEEVGEIMNLTRERIRQLETRGLAKLKALSDLVALQDFAEGGQLVARHGASGSDQLRREGRALADVLGSERAPGDLHGEARSVIYGPGDIFGGGFEPCLGEPDHG